MQKGNYKKFSSFGPGGVKCPCCGPAPGKERKRTMRTEKRSERNKFFKNLLKEFE